MSETWAIMVAALVAGLGGLLVPRLIAAVPEPAPVVPDEGEDVQPKRPYADIASAPGLAWRSALAAALSGGLIGWSVGPEWPLVWLVPLVPVCVVLSVIDWHTRLLPSRIVIPATLATIAVITAVGLLTDHRDEVVRALIAMLVVRTFFWLMWFAWSAGLGFGDVRLSALVGLVLGWFGWGPTAVGVWLGFVIFSLPGLVLAIARRDRSLLRKPFPYGPFLVGGALIGLVWGPSIAVALWG